MKTAHSDYGKIARILINPAAHAFISQKKIDAEYTRLNYLDRPIIDGALSEYRAFENIIAKAGAEVMKLPQKDNTSIDAIYCRDASLATDFGVILCNMGKADRNIEPENQRAFFQSQGVEILGTIEAPGTVEGGDMCWLDEKTLAIGHTYRTNYSGIEQIKSFLEPKGIEVFVVELPHFRGPSDVFHLMSIISPIDKDLAVVYSPLMPIYFREALLKRNYRLVECPEEEFDSMGCNVLALAPSHCLTVEGNPITQERLVSAGCKVETYKGDNISNLGCGGPTCLTRPLERIV
ncbi:dimethylarginine dimethylaminohydrolase family protein [Roseivirga pacifica]